MKGAIQAEDDDGCGIRVEDNAGVEHWIEFDFDEGTITYHEQDGYPDAPDDRTADENEAVDQARRFARSFVQRQTGHDVVPVQLDVLGTERAKRTVDTMTDSAFERVFGPAYDQLGALSAGSEPPIPLPPGVDRTDPVVVLVDLYLAEDPAEVDSELHVRYAADDEWRTQWRTDDAVPDRAPDARAQLSLYLPSIDSFREYVAYTLRCQLRDCYVGMGVEPPEEYRVLGPGTTELSARYANPEITVYEPYHELDVDGVPDYDLQFDYGLGEPGKRIAQLGSRLAALSAGEGSLAALLGSEMTDTERSTGDTATDDRSGPGAGQ